MRRMMVFITIILGFGDVVGHPREVFKPKRRLRLASVPSERGLVGAHHGNRTEAHGSPPLISQTEAQVASVSLLGGLVGAHHLSFSDLSEIETEGQ